MTFALNTLTFQVYMNNTIITESYQAVNRSGGVTCGESKTINIGGSSKITSIRVYAIFILVEFRFYDVCYDILNETDSELALII